MTPNCIEVLLRFEELTATTNVYDVYGKCYSPSPSAEMYKLKDELVEDNGKQRKHYFTAADYTPWLFKTRAIEGENYLMEFPPCTFG